MGMIICGSQCGWMGSGDIVRVFRQDSDYTGPFQRKNIAGK